MSRLWWKTATRATDTLARMDPFRLFAFLGFNPVSSRGNAAVCYDSADPSWKCCAKSYWARLIQVEEDSLKRNSGIFHLKIHTLSYSRIANTSLYLILIRNLEDANIVPTLAEVGIRPHPCALFLVFEVGVGDGSYLFQFFCAYVVPFLLGSDEN